MERTTGSREATRTLGSMQMGPAITSRSNARVKALRAAFSGEARLPGELLGIEGEHLIAEAMRSGIALETVFVREGSEAVLERPTLKGTKGIEGIEAREWVLLKAEVFDSAVETGSPQGIAATLRIPTVRADGCDVVLVVEALQDPGNLGTLLRSAEAFGAGRMMVTPETVSAWNPKVVRASAGSVFRVPVARAPLAEIAARLKAEGVRVFAAVAQSEGAATVMEASLNGPCAVMIGNEGAGLSAEALAMADERVTIPCAVESLNAAVAGSTILYEAMRQRAVKR